MKEIGDLEYLRLMGLINRRRLEKEFAIAEDRKRWGWEAVWCRDKDGEKKTRWQLPNGRKVDEVVNKEGRMIGFTLVE